MALFDRKQEIAAACSLLVIFTPPYVRMASHAVPWAFIIFEQLALLFTLIVYAKSHKWGWLAGLGGVLGLLFVTSETFFVSIVGLILIIPFLLGMRF